MLLTENTKFSKSSTCFTVVAPRPMITVDQSTCRCGWRPTVKMYEGNAQ